MSDRIHPCSDWVCALPAGISSSFAELGDLSVHFLEAGNPDDPCILLLHGFPELGYSWRKNLLPLAAAGYHVIAPDLRGFGQTAGWDDRYGAPLYPFSSLGMAGDIIRLATALGKERIRLIAGHDSGAQIAAVCALLRPDLFQAVIAMSTPFSGAPSRVAGRAAAPKPLERDAVISALSNLEKPRKHYALYYASPQANGDLLRAPQGLSDWFRGYFYAKSADWPGNHPAPLSGWTADALQKIPTYYIMNQGETMAETAMAYLDSLKGAPYPCRWITPADFAVYAEEYARTGFQGALNGYRCGADGLNAAQLALFSGLKMKPPFLFLAGEKDWGVYQFPGALETMEKEASCDYRGTVLIPGAGHWVQQEQPEQVNRIILDFLSRA